MPSSVVAQSPPTPARFRGWGRGWGEHALRALVHVRIEAPRPAVPAAEEALGWSTINNYCQRWAAAMKSMGTINPSGTNDRGKLNIAENLFQEEEKETKKDKVKKGRAFVLAHCYEVLKDVEKWKVRDDQEEIKKNKATIDLDDDEEASSDDGKRSPTLNSVAYSKPKIPNGSKKEAKEKKKRKGGDELTNAMGALLEARKKATEVQRKGGKRSSSIFTVMKAWSKKRSMGMGGFGGMGATMEGLRGMGGFEGIRATMGDRRGIDGFEATMKGMETSTEGIGGLRATMRGMGASTGGMCGFRATMEGMSFGSLMKDM
ncbi:hypothetical protein D1007_09767 [Hordeum vulgare]|nr:hypothetical protein D1007_09767 [Hordeum vulgare]